MFPWQTGMVLCIRQSLYNNQLMYRPASPMSLNMTGLNSTFAALSDPTRLALLTRLTRGEATVMDLAAPFAMSQPAISRHLKVLEQAGLISRRIDGSKRPCRLEPKGLEAVDEWLEMMRRAMTRNYERLDALLATMPSTSGDES